ncbi:bZIP transcription factor (MetR), putative [Cordyceps militaris CM01]|uniref:BZIP transcription factor (MetR), putative n=1 Tax=Cordyceps militaris (strain CM01) TaxID=983644 RepID=G3J801_CORMM|nr:bZIP transcription factor (MetR), putative [Cordyceps militaris CM01]EGX97212.1 bZIP transcription factor (MetR), putative [Cordyceps militaris CM01]
MSNYNGRHGPNVSNYLRDLNTISPQESSVDENFPMEGDLALFTNTEFFDFETGQNTDFQAQPTKEVAHSTPASDDVSATPSVMGDMPNLDFISTSVTALLLAFWGCLATKSLHLYLWHNSPAYLQIATWQLGQALIGAASCPNQPVKSLSCTASGSTLQGTRGLQMAGPMVQYLVMLGAPQLTHPNHPICAGPHGLDDFAFNEFNNTYGPQMNTFAEPNHNFQPLQPNHGPQMAHQNAQYHAAAARAAEIKHKAEPIAPKTQAMHFEESSRVAAEEDKRRRNTAASARFRIKKKQREQALEKSAKDMHTKVTDLENKVSQLETENKWLKNLLVEKNEGNEDIAALWKEFTKQAGSKLSKSTGSSSANAGKEER